MKKSSTKSDANSVALLSGDSNKDNAWADSDYDTDVRHFVFCESTGLTVQVDPVVEEENSDSDTELDVYPAESGGSPRGGAHRSPASKYLDASPTPPPKHSLLVDTSTSTSRSSHLHTKDASGVFSYPLFLSLNCEIRLGASRSAMSSGVSDTPSSEVKIHSFPISTVPWPSVVKERVAELSKPAKAESSSAIESDGDTMSPRSEISPLRGARAYLRFMCLVLPNSVTSASLGVSPVPLPKGSTQAHTLTQLPKVLRHIIQVLQGDVKSLVAIEVLSALRSYSPLRQNTLDIVYYHLSSLPHPMVSTHTLRLGTM